MQLRPPRHAGAVPGMRAGPHEGTSMRRRLFAILSAVSLLLFVAVVVMWVRSYDPGDFVRYCDPPSAFSFESSRGLCQITWGDFVAHYDSPTAGWDISF